MLCVGLALYATLLDLRLEHFRKLIAVFHFYSIKLTRVSYELRPDKNQGFSLTQFQLAKL